ncbi:hypothetical protein KSP39_PZI022029 [Platanthera zijinensis]|uniref:Uncharacterized protein n=1 Tax=Platanthera zijinensis TaxID=2320716 RepID=A0AAP0AZ35_9ASPA
MVLSASKNHKQTEVDVASKLCQLSRNFCVLRAEIAKEDIEFPSGNEKISLSESKLPASTGENQLVILDDSARIPSDSRRIGENHLVILDDLYLGCFSSFSP